MKIITFADNATLEYSTAFFDRLTENGNARDGLFIQFPRSITVSELATVWTDINKTKAFRMTNDEVPAEDGTDAVITVENSYTEYAYLAECGESYADDYTFVKVYSLAKDEIQQPLIEELTKSMSDEDAIHYTLLFKDWSGNSVSYTKGDRVQYNGILYRCLKAHKSQSDWTPLAAASLWVNIADPKEEWPLIPNPILATAPFMAEQKGKTVDERKWVSLIDNNVWQPTDYPAGWEEVTE